MESLNKKIESLLESVDAVKYENIHSSMKFEKSRERLVKRVRDKILDNPERDVLDIVDDIELEYYL